MTTIEPNVTVLAHVKSSDWCVSSGCSSSATPDWPHRLALAASPAEPLNIVVTIPVLEGPGSNKLADPMYRVTSLLSGYENEHTYSPKPSDLVAVRKARLLFEVGIGLEVWVSSLVKNAGSPSLRVVTTSQGIGLIRDHADHRDETSSGGEAREDQAATLISGWILKMSPSCCAISPKPLIAG